MNKMFKKASLVLAAILSVTVVMSGCAAKKGTGTSTQGSSAETQGATTAKQALEPYEIVIALPGVEQKDIQLIQEKINSITREKINATVKFTTIGFASWNQQINLMLASSEKLDLLWTSSFFNYSANVAKGQLVALDSLLEKSGKDIKANLDTSIINAAKVNGKLYGIPSIRDFAANYGFILRKDLVTKHKIDINAIKTVNDMTSVLKTIKDNEPNIIPFATTQTNTIAELMGQGTYDKLDNWMGVVDLKDSSLKVVNFYESKFYSDTLSLVRQWFQAGYLSKDAATSKETPDSLVKADKAFAYAYAGKPGIDTQEGKKTGKEMVFVSLTSPISTTSNITSGMASIPINAKDQDRVMMLLNLWYGDKDLVNAFDNGIEGTHYVKKSNGLLDFPEGINASTTRYTPINFRIGNNFLAHVWNGDPADLWAQTDKFNKEAVKSKALGFTFDSEPVKTEVAAVSNVITQYRMGLETGTLDPKVTLPEFTSKLKASGIEKIIAEKQTQLTNWSKSTK